MKRKLLALALIVIVMSLSAFGTTAYYTASVQTHNVITAGNVKIALQEWADADKKTPFPDTAVSAVPGSVATKVVEIKNTGSAAAYVRVLVEKSLSDDAVALNYDTQNWTEREDGFWYYNTALKSGATTPPLFTTVTFDADEIGNGKAGEDVTIQVTGYAVQVANQNVTYPWDAKGWPELPEE